MRCANCAYDSPSEMNFCGKCGAVLTARSDAEAERRPLTVMFCDLVDSTKLSENLDPEDLRDVLHVYQSAASRVVDKYEGHVAQHLGDGLLVYFGYPMAHEDDAERAVLSGLEIISNMPAVNAAIAGYGVELAVRIGLETGPVVTSEVGSGETREHLALGQTPNVAARIEGSADSDSVFIGDATRHLLGRRFELESRGKQEFKGVSEPLEVFKVLGLANVPRASGDELLLGRDQEREQLQRAAAMARDSSGSHILLTGDAGVGKSTLANVLRSQSELDDTRWISVRCGPFLKDSPFAAPLNALREEFGLDEGDPVERMESIRSALGSLRNTTEDVALEVLATRLGINLSSQPASQDLSPEVQREVVIEALTAVIQGWSEHSTVILELEDLHWADPSTLVWISRFAPQVRSKSMLVLSTSRIGAEQLKLSPDATISLGRLEKPAIRDLLARLAGASDVDESVVDLLNDRADGVPLYVEELAREMLESGSLVIDEASLQLASNAEAARIPLTLQSSLVSRLDRIGDAKQAAQAASVIGRTFDTQFLVRLLDRAQSDVRSWLQALEAASVINSAGSERYSFKHALVQDAAYSMLLKSKRSELHDRTADLLIRDEATPDGQQLAIIARHYTLAGNWARSSDYWLQAGHGAMQSSGVDEATAHFEEGIDSCRNITSAVARAPVEVELQVALGSLIYAARGVLDPVAEKAFERVSALTEFLGDTEQHFWALNSVRQFDYVRGQLNKALELDERMLQLATRSANQSLRAVALLGVGNSHLFMGNFPKVEAPLEEALRICPQDYPPMRTRLGYDLTSSVNMTICMGLWHVGRANDARERSEIARTHAIATGHGFSIAATTVWAGAELYHFMDEPEAVAEFTAELLPLAQANGYQIWSILGTMLDLWAKARLAEDLDVKLASANAANQFLFMMRSLGTVIATSYFAGVVADAFIAARDFDSARKAVQEGLDAANSGERWWQAELHRLDAIADLTEYEQLTDEQVQNVVTALNTSVNVAREQGSKALELRAATTLAQLEDRLSMDLGGIPLVKRLVDELADSHSGKDLDIARTLVDPGA